MLVNLENDYKNILKEKYKRYIIDINGVKTDIYTNHLFDIVKKVDLNQIAINAGLIDSMNPLCIVQYFVEDENGKTEPVIAFVWSWAGPWAFVYKVNKPEESSTDTLFIEYFEKAA